MKNVSAERSARFFAKVASGYRVNKAIRDLCVFARQDVTKDPPFSNLDLISCRNFLIYVQPELQERIISTLHYALNPSGFLLLGNAESAASYPQMFTPLNKKSKIYSKKTGNHHQQRMFKTSRTPIHATALPVMKAQPISRASQNEAALQQLADRIALKECAPPGVIVNDTLEILQFRGRTSPYLEPAAGRANLNILNMAVKSWPLLCAPSSLRPGKKRLQSRRRTSLLNTTTKSVKCICPLFLWRNQLPEWGGVISSSLRTQRL
ncbi:MAG: signal transduction histidine kinase [Edaphobacter sp.]|nr:signal transduction histidine kinase [Edaphobacter sp.]